MSAQPIGPGSMVVCVSTRQNDQQMSPGYRLTMGALYCVDTIRPWADGCCLDGCELGFVLKGREAPVAVYDNRPVAIGYCPSQFRPLNDGDTSLVEKEETYDDIIGAGLQTYRVKEPTS